MAFMLLANSKPLLTISIMFRCVAEQTRIVAECCPQPRSKLLLQKLSCSILRRAIVEIEDDDELRIARLDRWKLGVAKPFVATGAAVRRGARNLASLATPFFPARRFRKGFDETFGFAKFGAARGALFTWIMLASAGCAEAPLDRSGALSSYEGLASANGLLAHSMLRVSKDDVLAAKTLRIVPTAFSAAATQATLSAEQGKLIGNTIDRSLCLNLADRFAIVPSTAPADLTVHATVTHISVTNEVAAGASKIVSIVPTILLPGVPVPIPRLPVGLGSLSVEAEARAPNGKQEAAMIWALGANSLTNQPKVSAVGDAYDLARSFGGDFSRLLVSGTNPYGQGPTLPSAGAVAGAFGFGDKSAACAAFGSEPGVGGMIGGAFGLPPEWADKGAPDQTNRSDPSPKAASTP